MQLANIFTKPLFRFALTQLHHKLNIIDWLSLQGHTKKKMKFGQPRGSNDSTMFPNQDQANQSTAPIFQNKHSTNQTAN